MTDSSNRQSSMLHYYKGFLAAVRAWKVLTLTFSQHIYIPLERCRTLATTSASLAVALLRLDRPQHHPKEEAVACASLL